jgi:L-fuconolactonase
MRDVSRVDSHVHFWRFDPREYPWMSADMHVLMRDHLPTDLAPLMASKQIEACVAVQARMSEEETDFLLELARVHPRIAAVIGWADLRAADLGARLQRWAGSRSLAGLRHILQNDPGAGALLASADFRGGVRTLQDSSLVYEILISADQLPLVTDFCQALDRHWLVLDHLGKPDVRSRRLEPWIRDVAPLARLPHVVCKLSGIVTEANDAGGSFDESHLREYLDAALNLFGADRLMFGSDWPVCTLVASYARTTEIVENWAARLAPDDRDRIWGDTARRVYGLPRR